MPRRNVNPQDAKRQRVYRTCPRRKRGSYATRVEAEAILKLIRESSKRYQVPHRVYECELCPSFHLTGQLIAAPPLPRRRS